MTKTSIVVVTVGSASKTKNRKTHNLVLMKNPKTQCKGNNFIKMMTVLMSLKMKMTHLVMIVTIIQMRRVNEYINEIYYCAKFDNEFFFIL